jgi:hypothetical protein
MGTQLFLFYGMSQLLTEKNGHKARFTNFNRNACLKNGQSGKGVSGKAVLKS